MGQIMDIMNNIQAQGEAGRKRGLSQLVGKAYAADPAEQQRLLGLVAQRGEPGMAMEAQKGFDDQSAELHKQLAQRAGMVVSLYKANPQMAQQAYAAMLPLAARAGFPQAQAHPQLDDSLIPGLEKLASALQTGTTANVQSTYIDDKGQRVAIMRNGSVQVLGANAPNNQIIDTGNGFFGVNKGNLQAAPVMTGGAPAPQQQRAPGEVPFSIDPSLPPEVQADIRANEAKYAQAPDGADIGIGGGGGMPPGGQLRSAPKPINPMDQARLQLAQQAAQRDAERLRLQQQAANAKTAPKPADQVKADKVAAARADALDSVTQAISGIDSLMQGGGFDNLGTFTGDALSMIPHTKTKDASNALETVKNQVLLTTLGKLKALSATGASGFGALSNQEGKILQNSIANLETAQSHEAIVNNLKIIRGTLQKAAGLIGGKQQDKPATGGWSIQAVP